MGACLCCGEVGLRTIKAMNRRANGRGGEMGRQTEENDEKVGMGVFELKVQVVG